METALSSSEDTAVPVLTSFSVACRGNPTVSALPHVTAKVDAYLLKLSPKWSFQQATNSGFVRLLDRLLAQEWKGLSPDFRQARFEHCVNRAISSARLDVVGWWMTKYLPDQEDFIVNAALDSPDAKVLRWLYDQGKLPLDHPNWRKEINCFSLEAARWILDHVDNAFLNLDVSLEPSLEFLEWAVDQEEQGACYVEYADTLLDKAIYTGDMEIVRRIHANRPDACSCEALGDALLNGHLDMAMWLYATYPEDYFDDPRKTLCDLELIQWVAREYKWKHDVHLVVWIEHTVGHIASQDQAAVSLERDLEIVSFLYSIRAEIDREAQLKKITMPLPEEADYRTLPKYFPPKPTYAMDTAARVGNLPLIQWLHVNRSDGCTIFAMNEAAAMGHLEVVKWLHDNRSEGCSIAAMSRAIANGYLEVVQWLHANRSEGYEPASMDTAAGRGYLEMLKWLHANRSEGCSFQAMNYAAHNEHFEVVKWLHENRSEGCSERAIDYAADSGRLDIIQYLHVHLQSGCSNSALENAASNGYVDVMKWLIDNGLADSSAITNAFYNAAVLAANLESTQFLVAYCNVDYDNTLVKQAADFRRFDVTEWLLRNAHASGKTMQCPLAQQH